MKSLLISLALVSLLVFSGCFVKKEDPQTLSGETLSGETLSPGTQWPNTSSDVSSDASWSGNVTVEKTTVTIEQSGTGELNVEEHSEQSEQSLKEVEDELNDILKDLF